MTLTHFFFVPLTLYIFPGRIKLFRPLINAILNACLFYDEEKEDFYRPWQVKCVIYSNGSVCMQRMSIPNIKSVHVRSNKTVNEW